MLWKTPQLLQEGKTTFHLWLFPFIRKGKGQVGCNYIAGTVKNPTQLPWNCQGRHQVTGLPQITFQIQSFWPPPSCSLVGPKGRKPEPQCCIAFWRFHLQLPYCHHSQFLCLCKEIVIHICTALGVPNWDLSKTSLDRGHCIHLKRQFLKSLLIHITIQYYHLVLR